MQPIKIKTAKSKLNKLGAILVSTKGNHDKWKNLFTGDMYTMPRHGSKGRSTLSPGCTVKYNKFCQSFDERMNEERTNK